MTKHYINESWSIRKLFIIILFSISTCSYASLFDPPAKDFLTCKAVSYGKKCSVYLTDEIGGINQYLNITAMLDSLKQGDEVVIHLSGYGGRVDGMMYLYSAFKRTDSHVTAYIDGPVYSAHAVLAVSIKDRVVSDLAFAMFHFPAVNIDDEYVNPEKACESKKEDMDRGISSYKKCLQGVKHRKKSWDIIMNKHIFPLLTKEQIERYNKGEDVYIRADKLRTK